MPNAPRAKPNLRPDHNGPQRSQFETNNADAIFKNFMLTSC